MINFRQATLADLPTIVAIYNQTIAPHAVTADMEPVTVEQRRGWFNSFSDDHPLWVVEDGGQVIGWVGLEPFYGRAAYRHTAEVAIYFDQAVRHQGLGTKALAFMESQLAACEITAVVAYIFGTNQASQALFKKFGYQKWWLASRTKLRTWFSLASVTMRRKMMSKQADYQLLYQQALALFEGETDWIANASNLAALLYNGLADVNFAGFYRVQDGELILGPFQGQVACVHIAFGSGVCGTAAQTGKTQLVKDVHQFAGHIACDAASNSEIVVPIYQGDKLWGVLDIDSPKLARFDQEDQAGLERLAPLFLPGA